MMHRVVSLREHKWLVSAITPLFLGNTELVHRVPLKSRDSGSLHLIAVAT
jgi:hypothetical protein